MNAPLPPIIATIRSQDDLVEALRAAKEMRNLSFRTLDALGDFTEGHMERVIGPRREKGMSPFVMQMLLSMLAVKLELVPDPEQAAKMEASWEGRNTSNVRIEKGRVSKSLLERAKPHVLKAQMTKANRARNDMLSSEHRAAIASTAANARWKMSGLKQTKKARKRRAWYRNRRDRVKDQFIAAASQPFAEEFKS